MSITVVFARDHGQAADAAEGLAEKIGAGTLVGLRSVPPPADVTIVVLNQEDYDLVKAAWPDANVQLFE